jgi:hypothetical protein
MDFAALQQKLFDLDPSDRAEDLRRLSESVGGMPQESVQTEENFLQESVEVQEGTMPVEGDYSLSDFAALAGVTLNEGVKDAYKAGYDNYNSLSAISGAVDAGIKPNKNSPVKPNKNTFKKDDHSWKGFLQQHTVGLKAIAADPKKKAQFDQFMTKIGEGVEEGIVDIATKVADKATQGVNSILGKIENWYNSQKAGNDLAWAEVEPFLKPYAQELKDLIQDKRDMQMLMFMLERNQINKGFIRNLFDKIKRKGLRAVYKMEKEFGGFATEGDGRKPKMPKTRNPVASHAQSSGSGVHADQNKKKQPMRKDKHKKQLDFATESIKEMLYRKLNAKK